MIPDVFMSHSSPFTGKGPAESRLEQAPRPEGRRKFFLSRWEHRTRSISRNDVTRGALHVIEQADRRRHHRSMRRLTFRAGSENRVPSEREVIECALRVVAGAPSRVAFPCPTSTPWRAERVMRVNYSALAPLVSFLASDPGRSAWSVHGTCIRQRVRPRRA